MSKLELAIDGMTCGSCSNSITKILSKFDFVSDLDVSWEEGYGKMEVAGDFDENKAKIVKKVQALGYTVKN